MADFSIGPQRRLPTWMYGLPHAVAGGFQAYVFVAIPILLRAHGFSVEQVGWVAAVGGSPISWALFLCPMLDAQWSRRTYLFVLTATAALCAGVSVLLLGHLPALTAVLVVGEAAAWMSAYCCYGWKSEFLEEAQVAAVCGWSETWGLGGGGVFAAAAVWMVRTLHGAAPLGVMGLLALPVTAALWFPQRSVPVRTARHVFATFFHDVFRILRQRRCRYALLIFLLPDAAFAFAFSAVGGDFKIAEHSVSLVTGTLAGAASALGCLLAIPLCRRLPAQLCYIGPGVMAGLIALALIVAPKNSVSFTAGCLLYFLMEGINFAAFFTFMMRIAGKGNPLVTTLLAVMGGVSNISIVVMKALDGRGYTLHGLNGMLAVDGGITLAAGVPLLAFLYWRGAVHSGGAAERDEVQVGL